MHRFFVPSNLFQSADIILPADVSHQIFRVLRLKPGDEILLLDNRGSEYTSHLEEVSESHCTATVTSIKPSPGEPGTNLTLVIGITQREKFELILQKCTEIGVSTIIPFISSRTLVQKSKDVEDKLPRWKKIVQEAAEQSHRGRIPNVSPVLKYSEAFASIQDETALKLILWEEESHQGIKPLLQSYKGKKIVLIIGPEGGLSAEEVDAAKSRGFIPVSLGKRILRMETAAMIATGLVIYELG